MGGTHNYKNSRAAKLAIYELGEDIAAGKLPVHFGPLSFVFTGSGNVSQVCINSNLADNQMIFNLSQNILFSCTHVVLIVESNMYIIYKYAAFQYFDIAKNILWTYYFNLFFSKLSLYLVIHDIHR